MAEFGDWPVKIWGEQRLQVGMLLQCAAQQFGKQFLVITAEVFFGVNLLFDLRIITRSDAPLINPLQGKFAGAMTRAFIRHFYFFIAGSRIAHARSRSRLAISMATSAASPPLTCLRSIACSSVSVVRIALATGTPQASCTSFTHRP